ncbi:hypothetical protein CP10139811_0409 [Chlamydia ibidis]|uniref:Uncharacterized protein n=2 Tax=Chlamydia ibidis TaxID=1405396 RepID=S7J2L9_9CHLA|nr:hypothetical protein CP10139811_0409 [Chlamydia ibidis]EQM62306.1 hypothetical protein H359_0785 [Chlamydia ibidis 10-1398/6]
MDKLKIHCIARESRSVLAQKTVVFEYHPLFYPHRTPSDT